WESLGQPMSLQENRWLELHPKQGKPDDGKHEKSPPGSGAGSENDTSQSKQREALTVFEDYLLRNRPTDAPQDIRSLGKDLIRGDFEAIQRFLDQRHIGKLNAHGDLRQALGYLSRALGVGLKLSEDGKCELKIDFGKEELHRNVSISPSNMRAKLDYPEQ